MTDFSSGASDGPHVRAPRLNIGRARPKLRLAVEEALHTVAGVSTLALPLKNGSTIAIMRLEHWRPY